MEDKRESGERQQQVEVLHLFRCSTHTHTPLCHTPSFTHNFVTHSLSHATTHNLTTLSHATWSDPSLSPTTLSHTIFHTQLCHTLYFTRNFVTPLFVTHHLSHTQLCHTHTHNLVRPLFITHNFVTHNFATHHLSHTTLSHTIFHTQLLHDIHLRFVRQAWHSPHWAGSGGALGSRLGAAWAPVTPRHFAWQAWRLATSTFTLRGRRGTSRRIILKNLHAELWRMNRPLELVHQCTTGNDGQQCTTGDAGTLHPTNFSIVTQRGKKSRVPQVTLALQKKQAYICAVCARQRARC